MNNKVFISYCHEQSDWVKNDLVPCLQAGGIDVLIDFKCFTSGKQVLGQMDTVQDQADLQILIFSPDYLNSKYCTHEMHRAIDRDPHFTKGIIIPVLRLPCILPDRIKEPNPIYVDLTDNKNAIKWNELITACRVDLGVDVPHWLHTRNSLRKSLERNESINLVVSGNPHHQELLDHIRNDYFQDLAIINLYHPDTFNRPGLIMVILNAYGIKCEVPQKPPHDLKCLTDKLPNGRRLLLGMIHFDYIVQHFHNDVDLFATLRFLVVDSRRLTILAQSRLPFSELLPKKHPLSEMNIRNVTLQGR